MYTEDQENVMGSIPGLRGRPSKEIAVRNLSEIIGARYKEIIDLVYHEIKSSGYENKLMTGIVLTGGGSLIKNLKQLVAYITGKETRIGYPNEHLGPESKDIVVSPIYSTGVGLALKGYEYLDQYPEQFEMLQEEQENIKINEPTLMDRISGWFTEENVD